MKSTMKRTKKLAAAAIMCALGFVILLLGSVISVLDLTAVALASFLVILAVIELRGAYPYLIWLVTGILALLLLPDKFAAVIYLTFGGIYPINKEMFERLHPAVSWILKISIFNTALSLAILIITVILRLPDTGLGFTLPLYLVCNLAFVCYDIAATSIITLYLVKLRSRLGLGNFFK